MPKKVSSPKFRRLKRCSRKTPPTSHQFPSDRFSSNRDRSNASPTKDFIGYVSNDFRENGLDSDRYKGDRYVSNEIGPDEDDLDFKPVQRSAANARERARMRILSKAFFRLKTTLPWVPKDTKLSKLDTLRLASSYILHLKLILSQDTEVRDQLLGRQILNVNWPFGLQSQDYWDQP